MVFRFFLRRAGSVGYQLRRCRAGRPLKRSLASRKHSVLYYWERENCSKRLSVALIGELYAWFEERGIQTATIWSEFLGKVTRLQESILVYFTSNFKQFRLVLAFCLISGLAERPERCLPSVIRSDQEWLAQSQKDCANHQPFTST